MSAKPDANAGWELERRYENVEAEMRILITATSDEIRHRDALIAELAAALRLADSYFKGELYLAYSEWAPVRAALAKVPE